MGVKAEAATEARRKKAVEVVAEEAVGVAESCAVVCGAISVVH